MTPADLALVAMLREQAQHVILGISIRQVDIAESANILASYADDAAARLTTLAAENAAQSARIAELEARVWRAKPLVWETSQSNSIGAYYIVRRHEKFWHLYVDDETGCGFQPVNYATKADAQAAAEADHQARYAAQGEA